MSQLSYQHAFKKDLSKLVNFCVVILNIEDGRKEATFLAYYALLFQER